MYTCGLTVEIKRIRYVMICYVSIRRCVSVCSMSVTRRYSIGITERIELVYRTDASFFHLSYTVLKGNSGMSKNKCTSLCTYVPNSGLRKCQVDHGVNKLVDSRACWPHLRRSSRRDWKVDAIYSPRAQFTTRSSTVMLWLDYFDFLWISCATCPYSCTAVNVAWSLCDGSRASCVSRPSDLSLELSIEIPENVTKLTDLRTTVDDCDG